MAYEFLMDLFLALANLFCYCLLVFICILEGNEEDKLDESSQI